MFRPWNVHTIYEYSMSLCHMAFRPLHCQWGRCSISHRLFMSIMMHLCLVNAYQMRVVQNIAMTEMVVPRSKKNLTDACPMYNFTHVEDIQGGRFDWPNNVEAMILYAYYVGYIVSQIPGGRLADRFGARHVLGLSMLSSILVTTSYPMAIQWGGHWAAIALRAILGIVHGPLYPAISTMIQCWIPAEERGFLGGIALAGSNLGNITGNLLTGIIIRATSSWMVPFYFWASIAFLWYLVYLVSVFSTPETHPFITKEEREFLRDKLEERSTTGTPWKEILKSKVLYSLIAGELGHDYMVLSLITDLPKYFNNILKLDITANALFTSIPFLFTWIGSFLFSYLADWVVRREYMSVLLVRRLWTASSSIVSGAFLVVTVYIGCSRTWGLVLYTVAITCHGTVFAGLRVNVNDLTHHHGGALMAIVNCVGAVGGIVGPFLVGYLTPNHALEEWQKVFWIMFGIEVVTTIIYWALASADRETWDYPDKFEI